MSRFYDALREAGLSAELDRAEAPASGEASGRVVAPNGVPEAGPSLASTVAAAPAPSVRLNTPEAPPSWTTPSNGVPAAAPETGGALEIDPAMRVFPNATTSVVMEQFRKLRTKLLQIRSEARFRTLVVTSPGPREGKTVTALNLALSFSLLPNMKVLLVDADIRRGSISEQIGNWTGPGLSNILEGTASFENTVARYAEPRLDILVRGNSTVPPAELLQGANVKRHFGHFGDLYDVVLVDTPPLNFVSDTPLIAGNCDAVLLVARAFSTTRKEVEKAVAELSSARLVGTVLNGGTRAQVYRKYEGYY